MGVRAIYFSRTNCTTYISNFTVLSTGQYLSIDGLFLLKLIHRNTTCVEFDEMLAELWEYYTHMRCNIPARTMTQSVAEVVSSSDNTHHKYKYNNLMQEQINYVDVDVDEADCSVVL